jgi:hypothetical protein
MIIIDATILAVLSTPQVQPAQPSFDAIRSRTGHAQKKSLPDLNLGYAHFQIIIY